jgi:hypothetical protein
MGYGVYIFFASMLVLASIYAWFFIHETKGVRMDQMDELFGFERPARSGDYASKIVEEGEYFEDEAVGEPDSKGSGVSRIEVAR